jgi:PAS domain S-box-containing protein
MTELSNSPASVVESPFRRDSFVAGVVVIILVLIGGYFGIVALFAGLSQRNLDLAIFATGIVVIFVAVVVVGAGWLRRAIAGRKLAESALRQSEERYRALFDYAPDGIVIADSESYYLDANVSICRMLGYTRDEMIGLHASDIVVLAEVEHVEPALAAIQANANYHREWKFRRKDGSVFDAEVMATLMPGGNLMGVIRDISERKRAEEAARESEDQFRTMANSIPQFAWMAHADGSIFWYNQRWYDYTGTTPEQMEGWGWQSVHDPEVLPEVLERWRAAIATRQPFEMRFPLRGADGQFRTFLSRGHPMKDSHGGVVRWFGTNTDVDELKRIDDSLRATQARLNSTLAAGSVGTWTWDIVNDRLSADEFTARMFRSNRKRPPRDCRRRRISAP